jgi:transposase
MGPPDWTNQRRHEHQTACCHRGRGSADPLLHDRRPGQRLYGCGSPAGQFAKGGVAVGGKGSYDADWFRDALKDKGIKPCIPGRKSRGKPIKHDKRRNRIEIMFGRLKDWRRVATRYDRCPKVFLLTIALAATVMFWL